MFLLTIIRSNAVSASFVALTLFLTLSGCAGKPSQPVEPVAVITPEDLQATALARTPVLDDSHITMTSGFGPRTSGKRTRMHHGIDLKAAKGCAVLAWDAGEVILAGTRTGYGLSVDVRHADGTVTRYAHFSQIAVKKGQQVIKGEPLGGIGRTGRATTDHLHFEIHRNGAPVDPLPFVRDGGGFARLISPDSLHTKLASAQAGGSPYERATAIH